MGLVHCILVEVFHVYRFQSFQKPQILMAFIILLGFKVNNTTTRVDENANCCCETTDFDVIRGWLEAV